MPSLDVVRETAITRTARVAQVEAMFDVPPSEKSKVEWSINLPLDDEPWNIGLIVGPSGSGKTTVARELFGRDIISGFAWSEHKAVVDDFPKELSIKDVGGYLTSVGFSSIPAWLRPFHVLSNGEQFRVTLARALAETKGLIVFDEFSSVVDRQVAKVASHTIQKTIRRENRQFVAVSCHYDIVDWLQPDWIYQPHGNEFTRRSLCQRPSVDLEIYPIDKAAWQLFKHHHYMSGNLHFMAKCFGGFVGGECVAFTSYLYFPHPKNKRIMMGHRLVVLPDWQGLGIGGRLDDWMGEYLHRQGYEYHNVVAHPAMIAYYNKSKRWKHTRSGTPSKGSKKSSGTTIDRRREAHRAIANRVSHSFVYVPERKA